MKNKLILFLAVLLVSACSKNDNEATSKSDDWCDPATGNFMNAFVTPERLRLTYKSGDVNYAPRFLVEYFITKEENFFAYSSTDSSKLATYKKYAEFYGDTTYHGPHLLGAGEIGSAATLSNISITADRDFDDTHPKGTLLNDLFQISYSRFYQYIKSGYKPKERLNSFALDSIAELSTFKGVALFPNYTFLIFKQQPAPGKYTFTVTLDFGEDPLTGEKVTVPPASIEIEF